MRQCFQDAGPVSSGALAALGGIYPFTPGYQSNSQILAALFLRRPEAPPKWKSTSQTLARLQTGKYYQGFPWRICFCALQDGQCCL